MKAEDNYGSSDAETGQYSYYEERKFTRPRHEETYGQMRQREYNDRQERDRQESLRDWQAAAPPAKSNPYNFPEAVTTPNGTMLCQRSFNTTYCQ